MWKILKMASAFIGVIVGAGFASGQEVLQYFTSFGHWGTAAAAVVQNVLCHALLLRMTSVEPLRRDRMMVYVSAGLLALALYVVCAWLEPNVPIRVACVIAASLVLVRMHRSALDIANIFPEIQRVPVVARVLGVAKAR